MAAVHGMAAVSFIRGIDRCTCQAQELTLREGRLPRLTTQRRSRAAIPFKLSAVSRSEAKVAAAPASSKSVQVNVKDASLGQAGKQNRAGEGASLGQASKQSRAGDAASLGLQSVILSVKQRPQSGGAPRADVASSSAGANTGLLSAQIGVDGDSLPKPLLFGAAVGAAALVGATLLWCLRALRQKETSVDALSRRGFISTDRSVPLELIQDFEDPTSVREYQVGNARLVELEPLSPLTEEKMQFHRELRRREHGWKKPEHVLVEGDPIPAGVDPMTVRFIPSKHPFALSKQEQEESQEDWSEDVARRRLRQRRGRPEKEQQRSRQQLEGLRREMEQRDSASATEGGPGGIQG